MTTASLRPTQASKRPATAAQPAIRTFDPLRTSFDISLRDAGEDISEHDAQHVRVMRRLAKDHMRHCGLHTVADDVALVVTELVTNAIVHSRSTHIVIDLRLDGGVLQIAVTGNTAGMPQIRQPAPDAENGRGLILVQGVSRQHKGSWGTRVDGTTWCTLTVEGS